MSENETDRDVTPIERAKRSWTQAAVHEVREHPMAYFVLLLFVIAGPIVTRFLFPEAPRGAGLFGGIAFGIYACLCAMPQRFF